MIVASIRGTIDDGFAVFFAWLPHVLGFLAVLLIGYIVAKAIGGLVHRATHRAGFDRTVHNQIGGSYIQRVIQSPSRLLGTIVFWAVWLSAISLAVSVLGVDALKNFVASVWAYLPNVLAALLIFIVAGAVAAAVAGLAKRVLGDTALGKIAGTAIPVLVMTIATFMILDQLKIAHNIVVITYAALLGAIALGSALAFGLGGRDVARQMLESAYEKGQEHSDELRNDLDRGMTRGKSEVQSQMNTDSAATTTRPTA